MACNNCETAFQGARSLVAGITKSGTNARLNLRNQGQNIVLIRRILLCYSISGLTVVLFLRASPDQISWAYPSTYLEPGITAFFYQLNNLPPGTIVQAQVEYVEIDGRSLSCAETT